MCWWCGRYAFLFFTLVLDLRDHRGERKAKYTKMVNELMEFVYEVLKEKNRKIRRREC